MGGGAEGALETAGARSMGSEVICLGLYERPDGAVESAEGPTQGCFIFDFFLRMSHFNRIPIVSSF